MSFSQLPLNQRSQLPLVTTAIIADTSGVAEWMNVNAKR
jgi:hypothetical protein